MIAGVVPGEDRSVTVDKTLHFTPGGRLNVGPAGIAISITTGDFVMETGTFISGNGTNGAPIKVERLDGDIVVEDGAPIRRTGGGAGAIKMFAAQERHDRRPGGLDRSAAAGRRAGAGRSPSTRAVISSIGDTGKVISQGQDPGADLVHLQGCVVEIFGLVASTGARGAHDRRAVGAANLCNGIVAGRASRSTRAACVEIWAGTTLVIDSTGTHKGEVNADTATAGGTRGPELDRPPGERRHHHPGQGDAARGGGQRAATNPAFAVHANQILQNG